MSTHEKIKAQLMLMALFKATVEQSQFLTKQYRHQLAHDFSVWQKQGFKVLAQLEREFPEQAGAIESLADQFHEIIKNAQTVNN